MSTVQELVTKYTFDIDNKPLARVQESMEGLVGFASKLGLAAGAAAATIFGFAKITAQAGDEALATSQKLGLSVENLTRLQFAAKLSNLEAGQFNVGLRFLAKNMDDATKGTGDAAIAFKKLGIQFKDGHGKLLPTDQVLSNVADKLSKMPDGAKKTATAMDIFGKSGADMIPLLNEGAAGIQKMMDRSDELGFTMSEELARAGDEFNDSLDEMMAGLTGVRNVIGAKLLPALLPLVKKITEFIVQNRKLIAQKVEFFFKMLAMFAKGVYDIFVALFRVGSGLSRMFGGMENVIKGLVIAFTIFAGDKILFLIGTVTVAIWGLVTGITAAKVAAMAIPIAIGAAIALIALLIEDVYLFFTDPEADTMTGALVKGIKNLWTTFSDFFSQLPAWGQMIAQYFLMPFRAVVNSIKSIIDVVQFARGKMSLGELGDSLLGNAKNVITGGDTLSSSFGFTPSAKPANTSTAQDNSVQSQAQIVNNINVGQGADVTQVGKSVQQGTKDGMDESLRGAQRSFSKKGGY